MTYEQQQKRRKQKRDNTFAWLFIIGVAVTIFALGTLFGWHLTSHTTQAVICCTYALVDAPRYAACRLYAYLLCND